MIQIHCDGCGATLRRNPGEQAPPAAINGQRVNGLAGGGLPNGRFDWCLRCAQIAFAAVKAPRGDR